MTRKLFVAVSTVNNANIISHQFLRIWVSLENEIIKEFTTHRYLVLAGVSKIFTQYNFLVSSFENLEICKFERNISLYPCQATEVLTAI